MTTIGTFRRVAALGMLIAAGAGFGASAKGQVAFAPQVGSILDGVDLQATPVVSADRRYVRMTLSPYFNTVNGFTTYSGQLGAVGGGGFGGGALGAGGGFAGMNGPIPGNGAGLGFPGAGFGPFSPFSSIGPGLGGVGISTGPGYVGGYGFPIGYGNGYGYNGFGYAGASGYGNIPMPPTPEYGFGAYRAGNSAMDDRMGLGQDGPADPGTMPARSGASSASDDPFEAAGVSDPPPARRTTPRRSHVARPHGRASGKANRRPVPRVQATAPEARADDSTTEVEKADEPAAPPEKPDRKPHPAPRRRSMLGSPR